MTRIADLPEAERPRERLLALGAHRMNPVELLAILLGTGRGRAEDALALAERVLEQVDGPEGLAAAPLPDLLSINGIGPVKASRIRAAFELALRAGPLEPHEAPLDPYAEVSHRLRGQVAASDRALLAAPLDPERPSIPLELGGVLGDDLRPGSVLVRLLSEGPGPWVVAGVRGGAGPSRAERAAAERLSHGATLLGLELAGVLLVSRTTHWVLALGDG
ncbi:MAG: hypothetical protein H6702_16585 [Myxococcales bacterium]|nr:hypothetical protein [Myxococcales bacterium]